MPFDLLPHHNIQMPQVQFYHPDARLAQMVLDARQKGYDAMLKGLDTVLGAVDPLNMQKRRLAMMQADYEGKMYPMQLEFLRKNGFPMPKNPQEMMAWLKYQQMVDEGNHFDNYSGRAYPTNADGSKAGPYAENAKAGRNLNASFPEGVPSSAAAVTKAQGIPQREDLEPEQINAPISGLSIPTSEGGPAPNDETPVVVPPAAPVVVAAADDGSQTYDNP